MNVHIYWDGDDVLFDTSTQFYGIMEQKYGLRLEPDLFLTPENTMGCLKPELDSAEFMRTTPIVTDAVAALNHIQRNFPTINNNLATHRGYHEDGQRFTDELLHHHQISLHNRLYIDPAAHKDKMGVLRSIHSKDDIVILVDDNTYYDHDKYPNTYTVLIDKPWNKDVVTTHPYLRVTPDKLCDVLCFILRKHNVPESDLWKKDQELNSPLKLAAGL